MAPENNHEPLKIDHALALSLSAVQVPGIGTVGSMLFSIPRHDSSAFDAWLGSICGESSQRLVNMLHLYLCGVGFQ